MADTTVNVPITNSNLVVDNDLHNLITYVQMGAIGVFTYIASNIDTLLSLKGTPAWLALVFGVVAQVYKSNLITKSNDATIAYANTNPTNSVSS